jgi:DNA-directed RNA polymerase delta subunit
MKRLASMTLTKETATIEKIDPSKPLEVSTPETAMKLFEPVTAELGIAKIQEFKGLTLELNGIDKVKASRILAKKARCAVTNRQKELVEGAKKFQKDVDGAAKKIIGLIEPVETYLEGEEAKHQRILDEERKKEEAKKAAILQERCDRLAKAGIPAGNLVALGNMTDELFEWHYKDQVEKAEAARVKAEEERIQREKEQKEREEALRKQQAELKAQREQLAAEEERLRQIELSRVNAAPSSPAEEEDVFEIEDDEPAEVLIHKSQGWTSQKVYTEPLIPVEPNVPPSSFRPIPEPAPIAPENPIHTGRNQVFFPADIVDQLSQAETLARANKKEGIANLMRAAKFEIQRLRKLLTENSQQTQPPVLAGAQSSS